MAASPTIRACPLSLRAAAIELVLRDMSPEQQVSAVASLPLPEGNSLEPFGALLIAEEDEQMIAAIWAQPQPGRTAFFWPPQFVAEFDVGLANRLIAQVLEISGSRDLTLLQSIIEPNDSSATRQLTSIGFTHAADLVYLEWLPESVSLVSNAILEFEPIRRRQLKRLSKALGRTYINSFDCPKFDGLRTLDDTIAGYRATCDRDIQDWMIAVEDGADVGVLLLADFPKLQQLEMVYMGVVPEARNRGIGSALIQRAQAIALQRRAKKLLLAVDAANDPARRLYDRAGFRQWLNRSVFFRTFPGCR